MLFSQGPTLFSVPPAHLIYVVSWLQWRTVADLLVVAGGPQPTAHLQCGVGNADIVHSSTLWSRGATIHDEGGSGQRRGHLLTSHRRSV